MAKKEFFEKVSPAVDFPVLEKKILDWWYSSGLVDKYLHKNNSSDKKFSFLDGPITANNPMAVHHAWGRTLKDFYQRYKNMRGFKQRFRNGFDNQGLWVEVEVEKDLGFKSKKDIENYGIAKFVEKCKERTLKFSAVQTEQSKRLGYFMNWDDSYYTMSEDNNFMIWSFLRKCHENNWLYKGRDSVPWCPRCGTAISQHEILTEEYKELVHDSIYFELPVEGRENERFLVWTTTPWTIPANVALAVNPDFEYWLVKGATGINFWVAGSLAKKIFGENVEVVKKEKGDKLLGLKYCGPFDRLKAVLAAKKENPKTFHSVVGSKDLVTAEDGTGIVHIAPGCGQEDFALGKKENLPVISAIDESACYLEGFGDLSGKNAKDNPRLILDHEMMKERFGVIPRDYIFEIKPFRHRYPTCWRCKTELVWRVVSEWYIKMGAPSNLKSQIPNSKNERSLREMMMVVAKQAKWIPGFGLKRELDWLKNMDDWLISKKRYWGLALPIWECRRCGDFEVFGSKEELEKRAIAGWDRFAGHTPHRPWIDEVKIKCSKCGETATRIPDVGNPWLDAGIVSFSTLVDPKTKKVSYLDDKKYWREWFPADFVTEGFPGQFKNWFYSLIAMATVLEDEMPFKTLLGHANVVDEKGEEMHKSKGNAIGFDEAADKMGADVMRWVYLSQRPNLDLKFGFHIGDEVRRRFHLTLWNTYNFFITYANIDNWKEKDDPHKSKNVLDRWILSRLNRLVKEVTGCLDEYDASSAAEIIEKFVSDFSTWYIRRSRDRVGPAAEDEDDKNSCYATFWKVLVSLCQILAPFVPFLAEAMYRNLTKEESVHLTDWPTVGYIDANMETKVDQVRKVCELGHAERKNAGIKVRQPLAEAKCFVAADKPGEEFLALIKDELNVKNIVWVKSGRIEPRVEINTNLTPELLAEGEAREMIRAIQEERKKAGYAPDQTIKATIPKLPKDKSLLELLRRKTLASEVKEGPIGVEADEKLS